MREDISENRLGKQRDIEVMLVVAVLTYIALNVFGIIPSLIERKLGILYTSAVYILVLLPSLVAFLLQGRSVKKLFVWVKGQGKVVACLVAFKIFVLLFLHFTGLLTISPMEINDVLFLIMEILHQIFVVGLIEEFVFRIYLQETLELRLGRFAVLAPAFSAVAFGFFHIVNNPFQNVIFNIVMGLVWGYTRYFNKKCTYTALVLNHGLSNLVSDAMALVCGFMEKLF
jgi:membrane protease YdiL (CAAX protease family)